jgi:putative NIF3 family GTP cyclohydrolase 1 type 2
LIAYHATLVRLAVPFTVSENPRVIRTIAVCAGSGGSILSAVKADLYLTGEMSHHEVLAAVDNGTCVILCEHSNTERGYLTDVLKPRLDQLLNFDGIDVVVSKVDRDPLLIV